MPAVIYDTKTLSVICSYPDKAEAERRLNNAIEKGHKLRGRRYSRDWCERMAAEDADIFRTTVDHDVEVISLMSKQPVIIKASERGNPALDPSTESYWSM